MSPVEYFGKCVGERRDCRQMKSIILANGFECWGQEERGKEEKGWEGGILSSELFSNDSICVGAIQVVFWRSCCDLYSSGCSAHDLRV